METKITINTESILKSKDKETKVKYKPNIVFDFDGVIHSYTSGWKGMDIIPDPPVPGIKEVIDELRKDYNIVIVSSRSAYYIGKEAIKEYLDKYNIVVDEISEYKPAALLTVDDRAICFDGDASSLIDKIKNFKSYLQK